MDNFSKKYKVSNEKKLAKGFQRNISDFSINGVKCSLGLPYSVLGKPHVGHLFSIFLNDIYLKYGFLNGDNTLFIPTFQSSHFDMGMIGSSKNSFYQAGVFKKKYYNFLKELALSFDWTNAQFLSSEAYSFFVKEIFSLLYKKGVLDRNRAVTYWNYKYQTVVGDSDVEYKEESSFLYNIRYFVDTKKDSFLATTNRPDTIFADVALAVNPMDKRYKKFVGKSVIIPIINQTIPIIADPRVDMTLHYGVMRITPAYDQLSMDIAIEHGLNINREAIDFDGNFTDLCSIYAGKKVSEFFDNVVKFLDDISNLESKISCKVQIPYCRKTGERLEKMALEQWFLKISDGAKELLSDSFAFQQFSILPENYILEFQSFLEKSNSWCISRQYKFGQKLPVWLDDNGNFFVFDYEKLLKLYEDFGSEKNLAMSLIIFSLIADGRLKKDFSSDEILDLLLVEEFQNENKISFQFFLDFLSSKFQYHKKLSQDIAVLKEICKNINSEEGVSSLVDVLSSTFLLKFDSKLYCFEVEEIFGSNLLSHSESVFDSVFLASCVFLLKKQFQTNYGIEFDKSVFVGKDNLFTVFKSLLLEMEVNRKISVNSVFIHSLLVDKYEHKIGFIENNTFDMRPFLDEYGADVLRLSIILGGVNSPKGNIFYDTKSLLDYNRLVNKLWNAVRFVVSRVKEMGLEFVSFMELKNIVELKVPEFSEFDIWSLSILEETFFESKEDMKEFSIISYGEKLLSLVDKKIGTCYLELSKKLEGQESIFSLFYSFAYLLKLIYPYVPLISSQLWNLMGFSTNIQDEKIGDKISSLSKNYKIHLFMDILDVLLDIKNKVGSKKHEKVDLCFQATPDFLENIQLHKRVLESVFNIENILYFKQNEDIPAGFVTDFVIDINIGIRKIEQKSKKELVVDLSFQLKEKEEMIQYLKTVISSASLNGHSQIAERKKDELIIVQNDLERIQYELKKMKS